MLRRFFLACCVLLYDRIATEKMMMRLFGLHRIIFCRNVFNQTIGGEFCSTLKIYAVYFIDKQFDF